LDTEFKNIVFDFGGVLLDIDYNKTHLALQNLLGIAFDPNTLSPNSLKFLRDFEIGRISTETFLWNLQHMSKKEMPQGIDIIKAWNAMLIGWDKEKFQFLSDLKSTYNLYLLSNTNELHLSWVYQDLKTNHGIDDFDSRFFNKTYYSHLIEKRKPNVDIFEFVQNDSQLIPSETLFIDDLKENVETAKSLAWKTYHHNPKDNLMEIFKDKNWM
jgi:glucose-1-phosphatase